MHGAWSQTKRQTKDNLTNYELLHWLVETQSRDIRHNRIIEYQTPESADIAILHSQESDYRECDIASKPKYSTATLAPAMQKSFIYS